MFGIQAPESNNGCTLSGGRGKGVCGGGIEDGCVWYTGPCKGCFAFCLGEGEEGWGGSGGGRVSHPVMKLKWDVM